MSEKINALVAEISRLRRLNLPFGDLRDELDEAMAHQDFSKSKDIYRSIGIVSVSPTNIVSEFKRQIISQVMKEKYTAYTYFFHLSSMFCNEFVRGDSDDLIYYFDIDDDDEIIDIYQFSDHEIKRHSALCDSLNEWSMKRFGAATSALGEILFNNDKICRYIIEESDSTRFFEMLFFFCLNDSKDYRDEIIRNALHEEIMFKFFALLLIEMNDTISRILSWMISCIHNDLENSLINLSDPSSTFDNYEKAKSFNGLFFDIDGSLVSSLAMIVFEPDGEEIRDVPGNTDWLEFLSCSLRNFDSSRCFFEQYEKTFSSMSLEYIIRAATAEENIGEHLDVCLRYCSDSYSTIFTYNLTELINFYNESNDKDRFFSFYGMRIIENGVPSNDIINQSRLLSRIISFICEMAMNYYSRDLSESLHLLEEALEMDDDDDFLRAIESIPGYFPDEDDYNELFMRVNDRRERIERD